MGNAPFDQQRWYDEVRTRLRRTITYPFTPAAALVRDGVSAEGRDWRKQALELLHRVLWNGPTHFRLELASMHVLVFG